jgi:hypothetical protein
MALCSSNYHVSGESTRKTTKRICWTAVHVEVTMLQYLRPRGLKRNFLLSVHTDCFYVFCVDLRTNSDYFPVQH